MEGASNIEYVVLNSKWKVPLRVLIIREDGCIAPSEMLLDPMAATTTMNLLEERFEDVEGIDEFKVFKSKVVFGDDDSDGLPGELDHDEAIIQVANVEEIGTIERWKVRKILRALTRGR